MRNPSPNTDEGLPHLIGNFHKTLPHDSAFGEVNTTDYLAFRNLCDAIESGVALDFESVARGTTPASAPFTLGLGADASTAKFVSPMAASASETHGPDPRTLEMRPAPEVLSLSTAAEMVELYWMALLRDEPLVNLQAAAPPPDVTAAVAELSSAFQAALGAPRSPGQLALGEDLPHSGGALNINPQTLFRCGLPDEKYGPLVSQFFLHDIPYGTQSISQSQLPYTAGLNFLTTHEDWLRAQSTGKDAYGRDYGHCNFHDDTAGTPNAYYDLTPRKIATMRDLARFVNRDALHQAYFNAALFLDAVGAPLDPGNPYVARYGRQGGFATLGGPDLLTLVSEVASRALKVAWRQKWLVHRRARPEAYGGAVEMQVNGAQGPTPRTRRAYGLPALVTASVALQRVQALSAAGTCFLPMAYSAGSPAHPSYGAGHATVAGACVTVLKAWFDDTQGFQKVLNDKAALAAREPAPAIDLRVLETGQPITGPGGTVTGYAAPSAYADAAGDAKLLTIGGELNKLASNVAMGRSMGGVHWRSDNTRSLRLGEQVALEILRKRTLEYAERAVSFSFTSFDGQAVRVSAGQIKVG